MSEITPKVITDKTTKAGTPFYVIETEEGNFTAWDKDIRDELEKKIGQKVDVVIKESGDFKNIRGIIGSSDEKEEKGETRNNTETKKTTTTNDTRSRSIEAQCLTKCASEIMARNIESNPEKVADMVVSIFQRIIKKI